MLPVASQKLPRSPGWQHHAWRGAAAAAARAAGSSAAAPRAQPRRRLLLLVLAMVAAADGLVTGLLIPRVGPYAVRRARREHALARIAPVSRCTRAGMHGHSRIDASRHAAAACRLQCPVFRALAPDTPPPNGLAAQRLDLLAPLAHAPRLGGRRGAQARDAARGAATGEVPMRPQACTCCLKRRCVRAIMHVRRPRHPAGARSVANPPRRRGRLPGAAARVGAVCSGRLGAARRR